MSQYILRLYHWLCASVFRILGGTSTPSASRPAGDSIPQTPATPTPDDMYQARQRKRYTHVIQRVKQRYKGLVIDAHTIEGWQERIRLFEHDRVWSTTIEHDNVVYIGNRDNAYDRNGRLYILLHEDQPILLVTIKGFIRTALPWEPTCDAIWQQRARIIECTPRHVVMHEDEIRRYQRILWEASAHHHIRLSLFEVVAIEHETFAKRHMFKPQEEFIHSTRINGMRIDAIVSGTTKQLIHIRRRQGAAASPNKKQAHKKHTASNTHRSRAHAAPVKDSKEDIRARLLRKGAKQYAAIMQAEEHTNTTT